MKKLVAIIVLSLTLSNATLANVVPCNEPKCNKRAVQAVLLKIINTMAVP